MKFKVVFILTLLAACASAFPSDPGFVSERPVIGVLTQPSPHALSNISDKYIAASYVKYVEASGARVVPIFHDAPKAELKALFEQLNGVLFPGGGSSIANGSALYEASRYLTELSVEAASRGDYFVVSGHCLGYEELSQILAGDDFTILSHVDAENISLPLHFTAEAPTSRWFGGAPSSIMNILANQAVTLNNHHWAVTVDDFRARLGHVARPLSTNWDRNGVQFVSTFEALNAPIYAMQFHSEKPLWEWKATEAINHSPDAIEAMQYFVRFLGREARKSKHRFASEQELSERLIYNFAPIYTAHLVSDFEQCYVFGPPSNGGGSPE